MRPRHFLNSILLLPVFLACTACGGGGGGGGNPGPGPNVRVVVTPKPAEVKAGNGTLTFTATVENLSNQAVTWKITPGTAGGSLANGVYTPPGFQTDQETSDTITATSVADSTKSDSVIVKVTANAGNGVVTAQ